MRALRESDEATRPDTPKTIVTARHRGEITDETVNHRERDYAK